MTFAFILCCGTLGLLVTDLVLLSLVPPLHS